MRKKDVKIGAVYEARISNKLVPVRIEMEVAGGTGWHGKNLDTGRWVRIKSAQKLRRELTDDQ